jgi:uroporphyrin-III C-methyltransferase / precorrin-2 dehydrogenase / sirohydrochlorin ferrochelatase
MRYLPVFLDIASGAVALFGTGEPARNKLRLLLAAGTRVRWFVGSADIWAVSATDVTLAEEAASRGAGRLEIVTIEPAAAEFTDIIAIVAAAGEPVDAIVAARARAAHLPVNVVDRPELSTFIFPAIVDRGEVTVAIGTGGAAPVLARRLRARIEALLPERIGKLAEAMGRVRQQLAAGVPGIAARRRFWERVVDGPVGSAILAGRSDAETALVTAIADARRDGGNPIGTVFLVGAGPGDPDLLTLRALHALQDADVVFYDELVTPAILDRARRDAERIFVGKRRGERGIGQDAINERLVETARAGKRVVRLKGGDPFVFGRGGEELEHVRAADVPVVVVPGITAALGCAAEVGLPLTFRNEASRLTFVTAHQADEAAAIDWSSLADRQATLVVYMGLASAAAVRDGLIAAGRAPSTPAAVLARGTRPDAASAVGRLGDLAALAATAGDGPALLVIGEVVTRSTPWRAGIEAFIARQEAA